MFSNHITLGVLGVLVLCAVAFCGKASAADADTPATVWHDAVGIGIEGIGWADTNTPYDRLPGRAEGKVTGAVWGLSLNSAGLCVRFVSDASMVRVRWTVREAGLSMDHMPCTGDSGIDLYAKVDGVWLYAGTARIKGSGRDHEWTLATGIPEGSHEYMMNLPLYNGVEKLEIGVPEGASMEKAPAYPADHKPIVFWGTSILQGGCASRPGMVYTSILRRRLGYPTINLGFSGNGKMDPELTEFLTEVDASMFVIDCCPNMGPELITERTEPLVHRLREAWPETPIVLVENIQYQAGAFLPAKREAYETKNAALRAAYDRLVAEGVKGLHYIPCDDLLGDDTEATVDGTHATDLGFMRMAEAIGPVLQKILENGQ